MNKHEKTVMLHDWIKGRREMVTWYSALNEAFIRYEGDLPSVVIR